MEQDKTDIDLVSQFQKDGKEETFTLLVKRHLPGVRKLMYDVILNESEADDLAQDVFISVYQSIGNFRGDSKFSTWLYRIAVNRARTFLRKKSREKVKSADTIPEIIDCNRPDTVLLDMERGRAITKALNSLPVKLRTAIVLTTMEGMSYHEAAHVECCLKSTLYWRVHKARRLLKRKLKGYL